jgi:hypothetical protein
MSTDSTTTSASDYHTIRIKTANFSLSGSDKDITRYKTADNSRLLAKGWIDRGQYSESIKSTWSRIFGGEGGESLIDRISKMMTVTGLGSLQTKIMHTRIWTLTEPVEIELNLKLIAEKNAFNEVVKPIRELQKFVSPIERNANQSNQTIIDKFIDSGINVLPTEIQPSVNKLVNSIRTQFLLPPLASAVNMVNMPKGYDGLYSVEIGKYITLKDILLTNIRAVVDMGSPDINGDPISADVTLSIISRTVWTDVTFDNFLSGKSDIIGSQEVINVGAAIGNIVSEIGKAFTGK